MNFKKKRQIFATILAIILALAMIVPTIFFYLG